MQQLQPNTTLHGGKYRIERVLGQGGFGITYLASNSENYKNVAIKEFFMKDENCREGSFVMMPNTSKQELFDGQKEKFKKEAKRLMNLDNPHIIKVYDLFEENGTAYYVMDYVDGENLAERLKRTGSPMSEHEVRGIFPQILDALNAVHKAGMWHLDLKPANIMINKFGNVRLIDFGASKQLNAQKGGATTSTAISYTNGYAPREQMEQNYDKFGPWTDIYALGATLYAILNNRRPPLPSDIDDDQTPDKHEALPFTNGVSYEMKKLILSMLKTNRMQRPQNISSISFNQIPMGGPDIDEKTFVEPPKNIEDNVKPASPRITSKPNTSKPATHNKKSIFFVAIGVLAMIVLLASVKGFRSSQTVENGIDQVGQVDGKKTFADYLEAADAGDPVAQNKVGNMYSTGKGCKKSSSKAAKYYRMAAEQGNKYAQHNLGFCYWDGNGVSRDREEAIYWLRLSANQGYKPAQKFLNNNGIDY